MRNSLLPPPNSFHSFNIRSAILPNSFQIMAATNSSIKFRLQKGDTLYGLFLCSFSPILAEITGHAGYDYVVVDMEHGYGNIHDALPCLQALSATGTPAILRLPEFSQTWAKKALDIGPQGIMFPMIDTADMAQMAVSYCRYPPNGLRVAAHPVIRPSKYGLDRNYLEKYEKELFIMCQIQTVEGIENIEEIAAVDGVDCIQIGPIDLSYSMGFLSDPVKDRMKRAEKIVIGLKGKKVGPYLAGFVMDNDRAPDLERRGYHMLSGGVDIGFYRDALVEDLKNFKTGKNVLEE